MKRYIVLLLAFITFQLNAQTLSDALRLSYSGLGFSPRSIGMGNAFGSISDDFSAFYFNAAGLGFVKKHEFSAGIDSYTFTNEVNFYGNKTNSDYNNLNLSNFSYIVPIPTVQGSLSFGISYNFHKDFTEVNKHSGINTNSTYTNYLVKNPLDSTDIPYYLVLRPAKQSTPLTKDLLQTVDITKNGNLKSLSFAGAIEVDKDLFFGIDFDFTWGSFESKNSFLESDINNIYGNIYLDPNYSFTKGFQFFQFDKKIKWDIYGETFKFGFIYQLKNIARIGLNFVYPTSYKITENYNEFATAQFKNQPNNYQPWQYSEEVKYSFKTPTKVTLSASTFKFNTLFSIDLNYSDYTKIEIENIRGLSSTFVDKFNKNITNNFRSVYDFNIGIEHHLYDYGLRLRTGFFTQNSAYKNDPSSFNKKFITFGFGYSLSNYTTLDIGYAYGWWKEIGDNYGIELSRNSQNISYKVLKMGISTRF
ncbi:MAG TPA: outer membrane protein transport protein [Ignavibacteriales bacterium]|nr:outer membrane protein transport protein [Ignavibacteriales bacterium]